MYLQERDPTIHEMDVCSWMLTGETNSSSTTPHMDAFSWKLTGEANSTAPHVDVLWLTGKVMKHTQLDTTPQKFIGSHDHNPNKLNEPLLSAVDWGAHDSSLLLFLVNIDYDAKPNESSIQGLWGELQHGTPSIPLIGIQTDSLATGQTGDDIFNSTPIYPDLDDAVFKYEPKYSGTFA